MSQNKKEKVKEKVKEKEEKEEKIKGYNKHTDEWHCIICGQNMGKENSRQLCGKWICPYEVDMQDIQDIQDKNNFINQ